MCLYPKLIKNPRYTKNKSAICTDKRQLYVAIGCGNCMECRRQKSQSWRVRLTEEMKIQKYAYFITLTFSEKSLTSLKNELNTTENNAVATLAVRRFLERYRKENKKSLRHWLITELGHNGTERIHLHGIIFPPNEMNNEKLAKYWKYGYTDTGQYCNQQTINYVVKYVTKLDTDHPNYKAVILCSQGLGANFTKTTAAKNTYRYIKGESAEHYTLNNGQKVALPIYYRNKLYTEKERMKMWTDRLDKDEIYVNSIKIRNISTEQGQKEYYNLLKEQQKINKCIGYGSSAEEWKQEEYNTRLKEIANITAHAHENAHARNLLAE